MKLCYKTLVSILDTGLMSRVLQSETKMIQRY